MSIDEMMLGRSGHVFSSWSTTHGCQPELYFEPSSEEDLRQVLELARVNARTVTVVGRGYSCNGINCTDDYMISLKNMNKILQIDRTNKTISAQAGLLVSQLSDVLADNGLALSVVGFMSDVTLGAVVSTGYHGSGLSFGALEDYVLELWLMQSDGHVVKLSRDDDDNEMFRAATLSLGALGIIVSLTLQCERAFNLQHLTYSATLDDVMDNIDSYLSSSDHFRFTWFPHTDRCAIHDINRTTTSVMTSRSSSSSWFLDMFVGCSWMMEFLLWMSSLLPWVVPWMNGFYGRVLAGRRLYVDRSDRVFTFPCLIKNDSAEWSVPRSKFVSVMAGLRRLSDDEMYLQFPVDVRSVRRSNNSLLSPHGDSDSIYFNVLAWRPYCKAVPCEKMFDAVERVMLTAGGRPHWGKRHNMTADQLRATYKCFDRFIQIRDTLDHHRMFSNKHLRRVLGD